MPLPIRNVLIDGHRTSIRLEQIIWDAFLDIAKRRRLSVHALATEIALRRNNLSTTAAIRVYVVEYYRAMLIRAERRPPDRRQR